MGCVSLYDLKHHILTRRCLNNDETFYIKPKVSPTPVQAQEPNLSKSKSNANKGSNKSLNKLGNGSNNQTKVNSSSFNDLSQQSTPIHRELYKYAFYTLDLDAEPLWAPYLPSEKACDYRVLFALTNCLESDPPICVYNSDSLLDDQLLMQMKLFLNESIYADLCSDVLYLPSILIENCSFFTQNSTEVLNSSSVLAKLTASDLNSDKNDLDSLVRFLLEHVNQDLKEGFKCLLDLDSIHGFGENIDQYGRKELPFPVEKIAESARFGLITEYSKSNDPSNENLSWYKRKIQTISKLIPKKRKTKQSITSLNQSELNESAHELSVDFIDKDSSDLINDPNQSMNKLEIISEEHYDAKMDDLNQSTSIQQLNKDCLDYIQKNSPLISNSLSFLFDMNKRNEFFKLLTENKNSSLADFDESDANSSLNNSLNRFIQLYVPLDYMKHLSMQTKLNLVTQFLLTNKTEQSKIELIIDLANYYAQNQEWGLVLSLLNNCTQDNEELNDLNEPPSYQHQNNSLNANSFNLSTTLDFGYNCEANLNPKSDTNGASKDGRFSQKDLYNLFDHACICQANQEAKKNEKSFMILFKIKNFIKQIRAIFGLMHLWPIDSCLELIEFCITKSKLYEQPNVAGDVMQQSESINIEDQLQASYLDSHNNLITLLNNKKTEFTAYKELTKCARQTLEKYYEHQQIQDAAGFYETNNLASFSTTNEYTDNQSLNLTNLNKMKRICQKCLTWQFAKNQLESSSSRDDEETNELIMDLFLLNDQFTSAKYLIKKLKLSHKLQFKLDFGHLKHRLLNLNASSSIIVIDLDAILKECISFAEENAQQSHNQVETLEEASELFNLNTSSEQNSKKSKDYVFEICFRLLNELKDLNELNNQVLISLSEYLIGNYNHLLSEQQTREFKIIQLTARIFQILVQERSIPFDSYKRHHSSPLLIIEQLLMNSHIDLCSKTVKLCRDSINEPVFHSKINQILAKYARKALEFKVYVNPNPTDADSVKSRSPQPFSGSLTSKFGAASKKRQSTDMKAQSSSISINISSPQSSPVTNSASSLSSSFKNLYKFGNSTSSANFSALTNQSISLSAQTPPNANNLSSINSTGSSSSGNKFVMPAVPPNKDDWVRDEDVNECMVCNTRRFTLLNRRHHCRRCGRVVCSNCSQRVTLIDNMPRRTCDDCFKQLEVQKSNQKLRLNNQSDNDFNFLTTGIKKIPLKPQLKTEISVNSTDKNISSMNISIDENQNENEAISWQLIGGNDNETSQKRDDKIRNSFRYQQAPSTSLCLSILDLHDQPLECGKDLLSMCDDLSNFLQTANYQVEDFALIINMIKHLLHNAKVKLLQNSSSNIISLCDTYLSLIDILEQLLLANCSNIPSLYELRNTESVRRIRNRLLEEERHELAMNLSTKCGLDTQTVWASWGLIELRRGNYKEARNKFEKCLKSVADKNVSVGQAQIKILNDVVSYLENAPPIRMIGVCLVYFFLVLFT